ncbi:response regulator [Aestuariibacter salexigens]|uniref:response regulator n=1 Tax=Aestuariibacter salexigens TaxID=226010 RepID=UPI00042540E7|nr:response regulator [Aestuariibacter salexigens]
MIDIPPPKSIDELEALIIDDNTLIHDTVMTAFLDVGVRKIKSAENAYYALRLCENHRFDFVLIAFNVKSDKDGFHLLEEMKLKGYVNHKTSVIFLSADTHQELVNCIVELQPDDFWVKPLIVSNIKKRLTYLLNVKRKLHKLLHCLEQKEYSAAIYYAQRQLLDPALKDYYPRINRIIGDCLMQLNEISDAEKFYRDLTNKYSHAWVSIGLVRSLLKQDKMQEANDLIDGMLQRVDTRFATYDMLASYHIEHENYEAAYEQIKLATALAPRNIERNKKSLDLARLNHDTIGQYQASQNMAKYAKNSIHDSPELQLNVIRAGIDLATNLSSNESATLMQKIEKQIVAFEQDAKLALQMAEQLHIIKIRMLNVKNDKKTAEQMLDKHVTAKPFTSLEDNLDKVKAYHELGHRERCKSLLAHIKQQIAGDNFSSHVVSEYIEQESVEREEIMFTAKELKEMAATNYKHKRYDPAFQNLAQALTLSPTSKQIALSLLKVLSHKSEQGRLDNDELSMVEKCKEMLEQAKLPKDQIAKRDEYLTILASQLS